MHRHGLRPSPWQRQGLALLAALLVVSGAGWLALHYSLGAGNGELPHPAEPWLMRLHGAAAFAALFAAGVLSGHHIPAAWRQAQRPRQRTQRRSGLLICASAALVVLSGYALYYLAPEALRPAPCRHRHAAGRRRMLARRATAAPRRRVLTGLMQRKTGPACPPDESK